ncbi:MAG: hypothetical protein A2136_04150 [Chloroflexi bacterium RBG_16_54_11]|nr:MAG: hypothetical protein A2136_04150 [Chloroflexi bacterium RBG_16_54_11]
MKKFYEKKVTGVILVLILLLAALVALIDGSGRWLQGWLAYSALLGLGALSIYAAWRSVNASPKVTTIALLSFSLRLGVGIALALLLPSVGYQNNAEHQAGYVFTDAYVRDNQAWDLAISTKPISTAFSGQYSGDQYGGMLAISAFIYRLLSPDFHRPFLVLILGASLAAMGCLFLWKASQAWLGDKTALLATWIFALFPESVLLSSSQMREALVIPATAASFFALSQIQARRWTGWSWMIVSGLVLFCVQPLAGFISFAVLAVTWLLDPITVLSRKRGQGIAIILVVLAILLVCMLLVGSILANLPSVQGSKPMAAFLTWFRNNFTFQSYLTERSSGMFQSLLDSLGEGWRWLITLVYGIAQPVLPAVVGDPSAAWIMRIIGVFRAAGWYALALFLVYGSMGALRSRGEPRRRQLIWISFINWAWIMVAALNAGADQWDNPRYRAILLIWQVLLAAWAWDWARSRKDAWLLRWLAVEAVFVGMFTEWYLGRYYQGFIHLDIKLMTLITLLISGGIILAGVVWDKRRISKPTIPNNGL